MQKVVGVVEVEEEEVVGVVDGFPLDPPHQGHIHHQDHTDHQDPQVHLLGFQDQDLPVHLGAKVTNPKIITITSLTIVFLIGKEDHIIQPIIGEIFSRDSIVCPCVRHQTFLQPYINFLINQISHKSALAQLIATFKTFLLVYRLDS